MQTEGNFEEKSSGITAVVVETASRASHPVPLHNWRAHWLTVSEFARMMGRDPQTVYKWIRQGTLAEFGIPCCRFRAGRLHSGRVFIQNIY